MQCIWIFIVKYKTRHGDDRSQHSNYYGGREGGREGEFGEVDGALMVFVIDHTPLLKKNTAKI